MFSWRCSSPFWGCLGPFSPKYGSNFLKFGPEVAHHKTKKVCEQCFKIRCLSTNRRYPKFSVLVHFWAQFQFTPRKPKIFPKTKIFPETTSLGLSHDTSTNPQINWRILIKIPKIPIFWAQNEPKMLPGADPRSQHKFSQSL